MSVLRMRGGGEYDWLMDLMEEDEARREDRSRPE
jgi:hypothetical protein